MFNSQLTVFVCVADCGSFNKAAEQLYISPPAVMKKINALEKHLDMKLFDRTSQGIRLTAAGKVIYRHARFLFDYSGCRHGRHYVLYRHLSFKSLQALYRSVVSGQRPFSRI